MPPELSDHGIVSSLSKLTQELSKLTGKEILFYNKTDFDQRLDSLIEINIYRLTQEAINNAVRHAQANVLELKLKSTAHALTIEVADDGQGLSRSDRSAGGGIDNMVTRARLISAKLTLGTAREGKGTVMRVQMPLTLAKAGLLEESK